MAKSKNENDLRELLKRKDWVKVVLIVHKNPEKFDELLAALKDKDPNVRQSTTRCLAELQDSRAVNPLIEKLNDSDPVVRRFAASALGRIRDASAVDPLIEALNDSNFFVRHFSALALGRIGDVSAVDPLLERLRVDEHSIGRRAAARALGAIGDLKAVEPLINALNDVDFGVRFGALGSLASIGDERAIPAIQELLETEKDEFVRKEANSVLKSLRARKVVRSTESATQKLEKLKGETDISATVSVKISEIIDPLKEDLESYKEEKDQEIKERFKAYDEQFQFFHEELAPFRKVTRARITKEVGYSELNERLIRFEEMLSKTDSRVDKLFESLPEYMQAGFNKWMAWAAILGLFATIILIALQLTGVLPAATSSGT